MADRESILPLGLGLIFAIVLHLAVVPLCARVLSPSTSPSPSETLEEKEEPEELEEKEDPEEIKDPGVLMVQPDLVVRSIDAPKVVFGDKLFELGYIVSNIGGAGTSGKDWVDGVYLSKDNVLDVDDPLLSALDQSRLLKSKESYRDVDSSIKIPQGYVGDMFVIVKVDVEDDIDESPLENNNTKAVAIRILGDKDREQVVLGKDDETDRLTVAWISHEDFVKMQAPKHKVIQPAVQTKADPVANAPIEYDPTPALPTSPLEPQPAMRKAQEPAESREGDPGVKVEAKSSEAEKHEVVKASKPRESPQEMAQKLPLPGELPAMAEQIAKVPTTAMQVPAKTPKSDPKGRPANQDPGKTKSQKQETIAERPGKDQKDQPPNPPKRETRPTVVPRMQAESPLFDKDKALEIRPGKVLTGNGIEIKTTLPRIGIVARSMIFPSRNPQIAIRFNRQGKVIKSIIIQSSGNSSWDIPIVASTYKWRATGENLRKRNKPFEIKVTILIGR